MIIEAILAMLILIGVFVGTVAFLFLIGYGVFLSIRFIDYILGRHHD